MTRLSGFFDPRSARAMAGVPPRLQFSDLSGGYTYVTSTQSADGKFVAKHTPVPFGTMLVLDFGGAERGWLQFRPFNDSHLVPLHHDVPAQPEGDYTLVVRVPVLLQQFGLAQWTLGGTIAQNAVFSIYATFEHAREAAEGKILVCRLRPSRQIPIASRSGELHYAPVLEPCGWVERDEGRFGPRIVPPPLPLLPAAAAAPPLPAETVAATPQFAIASPAMAANDDDLFAGMTPVGAERPPF